MKDGQYFDRRSGEARTGKEGLSQTDTQRGPSGTPRLEHRVLVGEGIVEI